MPFEACSESRCTLQPAGLQSLALPDSFLKGFMLARHQATMPS